MRWLFVCAVTTLKLFAGSRVRITADPPPAVVNKPSLPQLQQVGMGSELLQEQLVESWEIYARIDPYLLDTVPPEALRDRSAPKGRTVGEPFAHVHTSWRS
jgi:hypothetical protein